MYIYIYTHTLTHINGAVEQLSSSSYVYCIVKLFSVVNHSFLYLLESPLFGVM